MLILSGSAWGLAEQQHIAGGVFEDVSGRLTQRGAAMPVVVYRRHYDRVGAALDRLIDYSRSSGARVEKFCRDAFEFVP